ncbi:hypothetical protein [Mesorhizobium sp. BHbdii]
MRFVIVISGWARLGICAASSTKQKKPPARPLRPLIRIACDLSGSFACGARHWTPYSVA